MFKGLSKKIVLVGASLMAMSALTVSNASAQKTVEQQCVDQLYNGLSNKNCPIKDGEVTLKFQMAKPGIWQCNAVPGTPILLPTQTNVLNEAALQKAMIKLVKAQGKNCKITKVTINGIDAKGKEFPICEVTTESVAPPPPKKPQLSSPTANSSGGSTVNLEADIDYTCGCDCSTLSTPSSPVNPISVVPAAPTATPTVSTNLLAPR